MSSRAIREVVRPVERDPDNRLEDLEERLEKLEKDVEKTLALLVQIVQTMHQKPTNPQQGQSVLTPLNQASP